MTTFSFLIAAKDDLVRFVIVRLKKSFLVFRNIFRGVKTVFQQRNTKIFMDLSVIDPQNELLEEEDMEVPF